MSVTIRSACVNDLSLMNSALKNTSSDWTSETLHSTFLENDLHWIIFKNESPAGFIVIKNNGDTWELLQIVIDENFQNQKLATQLLRYVINEAKINQIEKIQLEVRESNIAARMLYQKCGFMEVGMRKRYYKDGENAVLMDCEIRNSGGSPSEKPSNIRSPFRENF